MVELLKALIVVLTVSLGGFIYGQMVFGEIAGKGTIGRWRNIYIAATLAAFMIPNFWLVLFAIAFVAIFLGASERNKPALYLLLLFAFPVADELVPGFGGIRNFLSLYPFNILALVILLPMVFVSPENRGVRNVGAMADYFFIGFSLVMLALAYRDTSITDGFRQSAAYILTAFGPYLVFSRVTWSKDRLRAATIAFVLPLIILSGIAVIEVVLNWHVYSSVVDNWGIYERMRYTWRSGFLRAFATVFEPISFGLFLAAAIPMMLALISSLKKNRMLAYAGLAALVVGLVASFSRGPWVGAALAVIVYYVTSGRPLTNLMRVGALGVVGLLALSVTPFGDSLIALIPFVGASDTSSIDYRQQLAEIGWSVAMENKWFGSEDYMMHPAMQQLVQGQGIIDVVNSYLRVTLETGLVGLTLFAGVSVFSFLAAWRGVGKVRAIDPELANYCQAWLAALASTAIVIATTSSVVAQVAEVHWLLCGMCVGVARTAAASAALVGKGSAGEDPPEPPSFTPKRLAKAAPAINADNLPPHLKQYGKR